MPDTQNGAGAATVEDVAQSVAGLKQAVEDMNKGRVDRETVEQMVREAVEASQRATGYRPEPIAVDEHGNPRDIERELLGGTPAERFRSMLELPARDTAAILNRDAGDIEEFRTRSDNLVLVSAILAGQGKIANPKETDYYGRQFVPAFRAAIDTQTAGEGLEFVPTELSSQLVERVSLALRVVALFPEIPMPTNPFKLPAMALARTRGGRHVEQTADSGQTKIKKITPGTRGLTLTAAKFATMVLTSKEAEEDSIIAVLPFLRDELVDFTAGDLEDAAINGDTTATHRDSDTTATDDPRKNWEGIREVAEDVTSQRDHGGGDLTVAGLRANRKLMGKYGVDPSNLAHVIGVGPYIDLLSDTNVLTVDKYGGQATLLSGELGRADGAPLIVSEYVRQDLNASGVHDGVTTTKSVAATVHRRAFVRGTRRQLTVEFLRELFSESDQDAVKVSTRQALERRYGSDKAVAVSYNVDGS